MFSFRKKANDAGTPILKVSRKVARLADEFGVSRPVMQQFVNRFAPKAIKAGRYAAESDIMLFVHIPKTAGTSVGRSFQQSFDHFHPVDWSRIVPSFRAISSAVTYEASRAKGRHVIIGHFGWPEIKIWREHELPLKCGTIFREPVARAISNYNYNISPRHPEHKAFQERFPTLEDFARQMPLDVQSIQTVGMTSSFEEILVKLCKYYTFLGITEDLQTSLRHLSQSHGLKKMAEFSENVGEIPAAPPSSELHEIIRARSHNDIKLHALVARLYKSW